MSRYLYLTRAIIRNFRSIKELNLKNIGDVTVLIGPNGGGKSNILRALRWFSTDDPLSEEDKPVDETVNKDDVIVELYFEIINKERFLRILSSEINKELKKLFGIYLDTKFIDDFRIYFYQVPSLYLQFQKLADGSLRYSILDNRLNNHTEHIKNVIQKAIREHLYKKIKNLNLSNLFEKILRKKIKEILIANNIPKDQIPSNIKKIITNKNISKFLNDVKITLSKIDIKTTKNPVEKIESAVLPIINSIPKNVLSYMNISGRTISINIYDMFFKAYNDMKTKIKDMVSILSNLSYLNKVLQNTLKNIRPNFIYLSEEMELKSTIRNIGIGTWKDTLENEKYAINTRLFDILKINIEDFDKIEQKEQRKMLENKLIIFSRKLGELWEQKKVKFSCNVSPTEINLYIKELDKNNEEIREIDPEMESRGFKWYLAYLITLEYLKNKENTILLLDDPAVFLHERGQRDFLKTIEEVSKNVQIFYTTHLVSMFDEDELDRVLLVELDKRNKTTITRPWTNKKENIAAPVYHALGYDMLVFKKVKKIMFVEGISDKFIFEGLKSAGLLNNKWYVHPLFGGDEIENNELIKEIKLLYHLSKYKLDNYCFVLDGDKKDQVENIKKGELKDRIILLSDEPKELEDLIDRDFYLECVEMCYRNIFLNNKDKFEKVREIIEEIRKNESAENHITKILNEMFKNNGIGNFSKSDVAIFIKRRLKKEKFSKEEYEKYFGNIVNPIKEGLERIEKM